MNIHAVQQIANECGTFLHQAENEPLYRGIS